MKKYTTLFFDLDDTLLNFSATEDWALGHLFNEHNLKLTPEIRENYKQLNNELWKDYEEGKLNREEVLNTRFSLLFKQYGLEVDGKLLESSYRNYLSQGHHLVEGATELIQHLHKKYDLYVVTNGGSDTQYQRLYDSGLSPYFKDVFVSENTGFQKPMKEFFNFIISKIDGFDYDSALIIGDSLSADIKGGQNIGIDTCWFNHKKIENRTEIIPTYEIKNLQELYEILK